MTKKLARAYSLIRIWAIAIAGPGLVMQGIGFGATASAVSVSLNQTTGMLNPSQTESLTASVTGTMSTGVTWTLSPNMGTLVAAGSIGLSPNGTRMNTIVTRPRDAMSLPVQSGNTVVYMAPATISSAQTVTITATSLADPTKTVSAAISLMPPAVPVSISLSATTETLNIAPLSATLTNSQAITFTTSGANTSGVVWSFIPAVGTLVQSGTSAVYTVPSSLDQSQYVQVEAVSVSNSSLIAKVALVLVPTVAIALTPASADLITGEKLVVSSTITGSTNGVVRWSLSPNVGTIDSTGIYTAPTSLAEDTTVTVTAMAAADATKKAQTQIRVHANGIYFTTNSNGLASVVWNGTNYSYNATPLLTLVYSQPPNGSVTQYTPACSATFTSSVVTQNCSAGGDSFTLTVSYSVPSYGTVQAQIAFTNNSKTNTVTNAMVSTLGVSMSQYDPANSVYNLSESNPLSYVSFVTGRFAIWNNTPGPNIGFNQACGWSYLCKNQPEMLNVGPGQTATASFSLRFTIDMTESKLDLAPEAYAAYQAAYPYIVNWPDRRPIYAWFMSDHSHQSTTNPRGYFNQPTLNVSNTPAFQATALAQAQAIITSIQARPVKPQGIIVWDLEGQEFIQPTTYIGDPRVLSEGYDPEMNATADQLFGLFKNAGLKVGITLRPNYLQWGPSANLPATCNFNSNNSYKDYYVETDAAYLNKFYACYAPNTWSLIPASNGAQTNYQSTQVQQVISLLVSKVAYARARWGTTLYYVDSTVWEGGAPMTATIFRALQEAYPDSLFMPEESYVGTMATAIPYAAPNGSLNSSFAPVTWRYAYPNGAQVTNLSNCTGTCWTADAPSFDIGQKIGDIALYSNPQQLSAAQLTAIEQMILQARSEAGAITVTDSSTGANYSYVGTPATIYQYPVKMRVYFADSAQGLASSRTYCENGGWQGTNSCTLNLAGLTSAQIRYYDFEGNLVASAPAGLR